MKAFFYGLFMDESLLASNGIKPSAAGIGYVDGYSLRIGERATLLRDDGSRAWGVVMDIDPGQVAELYSDASVADYVPEPVVVHLLDGNRVDARCYNLPADKITGTSEAYAKSLLSLARRLGFPDDYLDEIRCAGQLK